MQRKFFKTLEEKLIFMAIGLLNYYQILSYFNAKHENMRKQNTLKFILTSLTTHPVAVMIKREILLMLSSTIIKYIKHYQTTI